MKLDRINVRPAFVGTGIAMLMALLVVVPAGAQKPPAPPGPGAAVRILVIDRQALMRASSVGQDIARQVQALTKAAETELKGEGEALQRERADLERQVAILAPDVKAQKIRAFQAKEQVFQQKVQARQYQIRYGVALAQRQVESVAGPVVQKIMQDRGANLMIDRQAVVVGAPGFDVTAVAVALLNQKLPTVKVQLVTPPPEVLQRMQAQQPQ
jgi:Skp family chaperone for outer membrane proteins